MSESPAMFGGNLMFATLKLANWAGIADEKTDPSLVYPDNPTEDSSLPYIAPELAYEDILHLENSYWIPTDDVEGVKKAVMEYGAVNLGYYSDPFHDTLAYQAPVAVQYYSQEEAKDNPVVPNHDVTLIGWDDNFSKDNFQYTLDNLYRVAGVQMYEDNPQEPLLPEKDGAWLIRNSWGADVLDGGYFWISYEDASIASTLYALDFADADKYGHNYQYDGTLEICDYVSDNGYDIIAAAVYTAKSDEQIEAAGTAFGSSSTDYEIKIYKGLTDENDPESGTLAGGTSGKTTYVGYYTLELDSPVYVEKGETFAVVLTAGKEGGASLLIDTSADYGELDVHASTENDKTYYYDTIALINALLTPEQMQLVNSGEKVEIRVEATDISGQVSDEDKRIIENGLASYAGAGGFEGGEPGEHVMGEPIEIVIGIPDDLQSDDRMYYVARSHEDTFSLLEDQDEEPETVMIETEFFSAYAIVFRRMSAAGVDESSGFPESLSRTTVLLWSLGILVMLGIAIFLIVGKRRQDSYKE